MNNLDVDDQLKEIEVYEHTQLALESYRERITKEGMSREIGIGLEGLYGGPIPGLDVRKLTINPSNVGVEVGLEAINIKQSLMMFVGALSVIALLVKLFGWLFHSGGGGGGGGGGGSGDYGATKLREELEKKEKEVRERIEFLENDREQAIRDKEKTMYRNKPDTVQAIHRVLLSNKSLRADQRIILMARVESWFALHQLSDAEQAAKDSNYAFLAMGWLALNPTKTLDPRICAFMQKVPPVNHALAGRYRAKDPTFDRYRNGMGTVSNIWLSKYIRPDTMSQAIEITKTVDMMVSAMMNFLDMHESAKTRQEEQYQEAYQRETMRIIGMLFDKNSPLSPFIDQIKNQDVLVLAGEGIDRVRTHQMLMEMTSIAKAKNLRPYYEPKPFALLEETIWASEWGKQFEYLADSPIDLIPMKSVTANPDPWPNKLQKHGNFYRWLFSRPVEDFQLAIFESRSRQTAGFHKELEKLSKGVEKDALTLRDRVQKMQKAGDRIEFERGQFTDGTDLIFMIEKFLKSTIPAVKVLITFCKHVEVAKKAAETFNFDQ